MALPRVPKLRVTPPAGAQTIYDLSVAPLAYVIQPYYDPLFNEHEMLDRSMERDPYGWRVTADLKFVFPAGGADDATMSAISWYIEDDSYVLELTLNGDAADPIWREGYYRTWARAPLQGKNTHFTIDSLFVCRRILQPGITGPLTGQGQAGHYDYPGPPVVGMW